MFQGILLGDVFNVDIHENDTATHSMSLGPQQNRDE